MAKSRVSSKGQVTVPVAVREEFGLWAGTEVVFEVRDGAIRIYKGTSGGHPVDRVFGLLQDPAGADPMSRLDEMRGPRPGGRRGGGR
jgi:AbrB family looped-hinge helix DNA binding protein